MPSPVEGTLFTKGEKRTLTFVTANNYTASNNKTGKLYNLTTGNNIALNNNDITIADNATGTLTIVGNLNESGNWLAQFTMADNNNNVVISPVYEYKVEDAI
jgi:hypothetical protein